jgi:poly(hydroxyalkanoate) granule-associated protein
MGSLGEKTMTDIKRKSKQRVSDFTAQLENVFLAGLGAMSNAQKMGSDTFETLVKDGEVFRKEASKKTESLIADVQSAIHEMSEDAQERAEGLLGKVRDRSKISKVQSAFDKRVADTMDRLNVPSKNDIDKINKKLNKILRVLEDQGKPAPAKKKTAARRKTSAKKAPAKKAAAKVEPKPEAKAA